MKVQSPDALQRLLREGRRGGVFFLFGDEEFLKEEAIHTLIESHLDPGTRDFNLDQLRAGDTAVETVLSIVATPPMMSEWRVVVLRDVQALAASVRGRATLEQLVARKVPGLLLVLTAQIPSGRAAIYDTLKKRAIAVDCATLSEADLPGWLMSRAIADEAQLDADAARLIAAAVGADLGILIQELRKLIEYAGARRITAEDVKAVVAGIPRVNRWDWFDLVGDKKFAQARAALPILLDMGENGVGLVIGLGTQFLRLAIGAVGGERALETALPPNQKWLASRVARQTRGWPAAALDLALDDLLRADRLLKSGGLSEEQVMEELLVRLQVRAAPQAA